jgi:hypothetical protein
VNTPGLNFLCGEQFFDGGETRRNERFRRDLDHPDDVPDLSTDRRRSGLDSSLTVVVILTRDVKLQAPQTVMLRDLLVTARQRRVAQMHLPTLL